MKTDRLSTSSSATKTCEHCGYIVELRSLTVAGMKLTIPVSCDCAVRAYEREQREQAQRTRRIELERYFNVSTLGNELEQCTTDNFKPRNGTHTSLNTTREFKLHFQEWIDNGRGIIYLGGYGNGKSHLAAALYNHARKEELPAVFCTVPMLMMRLNKTYQGEGESEYDLIELLAGADLLVLDDLGAERRSEKTEERIFALLNDRYNFQRSTVITCNFNDEDELRKWIGGRVFDRLLERTEMVLNTATSYREERRKKQ